LRNLQLERESFLSDGLSGCLSADAEPAKGVAIMSSRFTLAPSGWTSTTRHCISGCCILALSAGCDSPTRPPEEPPPLPDAMVDQVGLPENYVTRFSAFYVFDRADNRQVRVVYANDSAAAGLPFKLGSILVMETYSAKTDAQGLVLDAAGRYQRNALAGIFVMRKEKWFGRRYKEHQTGEWEYASFRLNMSGDTIPNVVGEAATQACAVCHLDAGLSRDWVFRANIRFANRSGAIPQPEPGQAPEQPFVDNYTFVPATITVPVNTRVSWTNRDQVKHTVTATNASFSGYLPQGATFGRMFTTAGTFEYFCAIHPGMRATIIVTPVQP
jgi:plastocyanin